MFKRLRAWLTTIRRSPRWRAPRTLKVTRSGRTFLVVTVGVGLGALNTGNNLLYLILGLMLSLIVASSLLSEQCLRDLKVRRILPDAAHAGEPFALRYELTRQKGWGFAFTLRELAMGLSGTAFVPMVSAAEPTVVRAQLTAERRGPYALSEIEVSTLFPFGLFSKARRGAPFAEVGVPPLLPLGVFPKGGGGRRESGPPLLPPPGFPWHGPRRARRHPRGRGGHPAPPRGPRRSARLARAR